MKKFFICLFLILIPQISLGEDEILVNENTEELSNEEVTDNLTDELKKQALEMEIIYESMNTCMPTKSKYMQIFGFEGNLCHFKYVDYNCFVPQDVAAKYSELGLKIAEEMSRGNISTESSEAKKIQEILSNKSYCSYEMTGSVTITDENGNKIPTNDIPLE